jgi:hypothetical protein
MIGKAPMEVRGADRADRLIRNMIPAQEGTG